MTSTATPPPPSTTITSLIEVLRESARLTPRDHYVIGLLAEHQVLCAEQVARLGFPNPTRARHRLLTLTRRAVLSRFRDCVRPGSQPWRYTLAPLGAAIHAAATGTAMPRARDVADRAARLSRSRTLTHQLGVNDFFTRLIGHTHTHPGQELTQWWPEPTITQACAGIAHPDGYGEWTTTHHTSAGAGGAARVIRRTVGFLVEHDTGTESLPVLLDKIDAYGELAAAGVSRPVLMHLPSAARETHLHQAITRRYRGAALPARVLTSTHQLHAAQPAGRIWAPAGTEAPSRAGVVAVARVALAELPTGRQPAPAAESRHR